MSATVNTKMGHPMGRVMESCVDKTETLRQDTIVALVRNAPEPLHLMTMPSPKEQGEICALMLNGRHPHIGISVARMCL